MNGPLPPERLTKRRQRMRAIVAKFQAYVATYHEQECYDEYTDKTFLDDMLYGIGIAISTGTSDYNYAQGYDRFKQMLREHLKMSEHQSAAGACKPESDVELAERLLNFYGVNSLYALIRAQNHHVEKLQAKLPRPSLGDDVVNRVREG